MVEIFPGPELSAYTHRSYSSEPRGMSEQIPFDTTCTVHAGLCYSHTQTTKLKHSILYTLENVIYLLT